MKQLFWVLGPPGSGKSTAFEKLVPAVPDEITRTLDTGDERGERTFPMSWYPGAVEIGEHRKVYRGVDACEDTAHKWLAEWIVNHENPDLTVLMDGGLNYCTKNFRQRMRDGNVDVHVYVLTLPLALCRQRIVAREEMWKYEGVEYIAKSEVWTRRYHTRAENILLRDYQDIAVKVPAFRSAYVLQTLLKDSIIRRLHELWGF